MKILIGPLRIPSGTNVEYRRGQENPGLGGTDFLSLERAARLAESHDVESVQVVVLGGSVNFWHSKIETITISDASQFAPTPERITISSVGNLTGVPTENLDGVSLVLLSHHPHDSALVNLCRSLKPAAVISVGTYPYWSINRKIPVPHFQIRDPFSPSETVPEATVNARYGTTPLKVGHISSLHPAKGFLDIASSWRILHNSFPGMRLEVVGGISLYGVSETHPSLPMERHYGEQVLQALGPAASSVDFLGLIGKGKDKIIERWHLSLLNPKGSSEADPASFKDCMRAGVPVIGGNDFGLGDYMENFPNLALKSPEHLVGVFKQAVGRSHGLLLEARAALAFASTLKERDERSWIVFEELIAMVARQDSPGLAGLARRNRPRRLSVKKQVKILARNLGLSE